MSSIFLKNKVKSFNKELQPPHNLNLLLAEEDVHITIYKRLHFKPLSVSFSSKKFLIFKFFSIYFSSKSFYPTDIG